MSAQRLPHAHAAPLAPGFSLLPPLSPERRVSPLLNQADGWWNFGESTDGFDVGGAHGADPLAIRPPAFVPLLSGPGGWDPHAMDASIVHYVGALRPPGGLGQNDESQASFELVAPAVIEPGKDVVVALFTQSTFGPGGAAQQYAPHDYPGDPNNYGLLAPYLTLSHFQVVQRNLATSLPFRVVGVQFTPRTSGRPIVFAMQRLRQVRWAAEALITARYGVAPDRIAYCVSGSSFGGLTAPLATIYYPLEFHAATGLAYSGAHRSMPSDYDGFTFLTSLLGVDGAGNGYLMRDTVEIPMWCRTEQTDFASMSFTNRWVRQHIQRPVYLIVGDEDPVAHGTDWAMILNGSTPTDLHQVQHGRQTKTSAPGRQVTVRWSIVPKTCHEADPPDMYVLELAGPGTEQTNDLLRPTEVMIEVAHAEILRSPTPPVVAIGDPQIGRTLTNQTSLPSLDHNRPALSHPPTRPFSPGQIPNLLTENAAFRRYGQGTWLGVNESLKVRVVPGDDRASVFVGSADGSVTRLQMQAVGSLTPPAQPLVEVARSKRNGASYSLGHGTWGLDVGDVHPSAGDEVVVASYDRIAIFRATDLLWLAEKHLTDWEYTNPRKLQVADVYGGPEGEIVFRTLHNHLVVMDGNLDILFEHGEGGMIDLVVGPAPPPKADTPLRRPIYVLSARGHLLRLDMNGSLVAPMNAGFLAGASGLEYGTPRDLDIVTHDGQTRLAALFVPHPLAASAIRFFAVDDCTRVGGFGNLMALPPPPGQSEDPATSVLHTTATGDMEPSFTYIGGHGADYYAISSGGQISLWVDGVVVGHRQLGSFPPAYGHGCVQAGNIDPGRTGDEVVVATTGGKVVWFTVQELASDLTVPGQSFNKPRRFVTDGNGRVHEDRCNLSLGATWAMAALPTDGSNSGKLMVIDPVGTWWDVAPDGTPTWRREVGGSFGLVRAHASSLPTANGGNGHLAWSTVPGTPFGDLLFTSPYLPDHSLSLPPVPRPWWVPTGLYRPYVRFEDGCWILPTTGDVLQDAGVAWCAWWSRPPLAAYYPDLIQRARYSVSGGAVTIQDVWGSTLAPQPGNAPPPRWPRDPGGYLPLRTEGSFTAPSNAVALKLGRVLHGSTAPHIVASTMGGRVLVLDGITGKVVAESEDYGVGGMALAVADLDGTAPEEIVFATVYSPISHLGGFVRSHLRVLRHVTGTNQLAMVGGPAPVPIGEMQFPNGTDFLGYGACGLKVANLPMPEGSPPVANAIVVTTLNGEIAVFQQTSGVIDPNPVFRTIVEGSVGAYNSIVIEDLDPLNPVEGLPEVYVAGSLGIRRFDFLGGQ